MKHTNNAKAVSIFTINDDNLKKNSIQSYVLFH